MRKRQPDREGSASHLTEQGPPRQAEPTGVKWVQRVGTGRADRHTGRREDREEERGEASSPSAQTLTLLDAEAAGPLIQSDVLVVVKVTGLEKASGAVFHGDEGGTQGGQLGVGQVPARRRREGPEAWERHGPAVGLGAQPCSPLTVKFKGPFQF